MPYDYEAEQLLVCTNFLAVAIQIAYHLARGQSWADLQRLFGFRILF